MKLLLALTILCISYQSNSQIAAPENLKNSGIRFLPVSEKIKQLPANSPAKKMTSSSSSVVLSPLKMKANEDIYLSFQAAVRVDPYHASFRENKETVASYGSQLQIILDPKKTGVQLFEINMGVFFIGVAEFIISYGATTQTIQVDNSSGVKTSYTPRKIIFALTLSQGALVVYVKSKNSSWNFYNCEISALK